MKTKWTKIAAVATAVVAFAGVACAAPIGYLTLSDNLGNSTGAIATSGGTASYNGTLGNWTINITTGTQNGSATDPALTLTSLDANFSGSTSGNVLTIQFTMSPVGPLTGSYVNTASGVLNGVTTDFNVLLDGTAVSTQSFSTSSFGSTISGDTGGATSIGILATLTASTGTGFANISDNLSDPRVPDGGTTVLLLGAALSVMGLFRKKLMA